MNNLSYTKSCKVHFCITQCLWFLSISQTYRHYIRHFKEDAEWWIYFLNSTITRRGRTFTEIRRNPTQVKCFLGYIAYICMLSHVYPFTVCIIYTMEPLKIALVDCAHLNTHAPSAQNVAAFHRVFLTQFDRWFFKWSRRESSVVDVVSRWGSGKVKYSYIIFLFQMHMIPECEPLKCDSFVLKMFLKQTITYTLFDSVIFPPSYQTFCVHSAPTRKERQSS